MLRPAQEQSRLSDDEVLAGLSGVYDAPEKPVVEGAIKFAGSANSGYKPPGERLSDEEVLSGLSEVYPGKPNALQTIGGTLFDIATSVAEAPGAILDAVLHADRDTSLAATAEGRVQPPLNLDPNAGRSEFSEGLRGARDIVYPPEIRGRGTLLSEGLPALGTQLVAGGAAAALGGPAAATGLIGLSQGMPLRERVTEATGDPAKGMMGLAAGVATAPLEVMTGNLATLRRLAKGISEKGVSTLLGGIWKTLKKEVPQEMADEMVLGLAEEHLSGEDVPIVQNMIATLGPTTVLSVLLGGAEGLAGRRAAKGQEAPETAQEPLGDEQAPVVQPEAAAATAVPDAPTEAQAAPPATKPPAGERRTAQVEEGERVRASDVSSALKTLRTEWASWRETEEDLGLQQAMQVAKRVVDSRKRAGLATTEMDAALAELSEASSQPPSEEFGSAEERAMHDRLQAALKRADAALAGPAPGAAKPTLSLKKKPAAAAAEPDLDAEQMAPDKAPEPEDDATGIKNAEMERQLEKRGLELPKDPTARRRRVEVLAEAKALIAEKPDTASDLVADLEREPRRATDTESAVLTHEAVRLINKIDAADAAYAKDPSESNKAKLDQVESDYRRLHDVSKKAGTISGQELAARQMMLKHDYSLAGMKASVRRANKGKALDAETEGKIRDLSKRLEAAEKGLAEARTKEARDELRRLELEAENEILKLRESVRPQRLKKRAEEIRRIDAEIKALYDELGAHVKGQAFAGPDTKTLVLYGKLAAKVIQRGGKTFAQWADEMVGRFGEGVRPHLKAAWDAGLEENDPKAKARITRLKKETADLRRRMEEGDFEEKPGVERVPTRGEIDAKVEREKVKREFERLKTDTERKNRTPLRKALGIAGDVLLAAPRALKFSYDLMPIFRQGKFYALPDIFFNPKRLLRHSHLSLKAAKNADAALAIDVQLREGKDGELAEAAGLDLPHVEEEMASRFAEKIPGIKASGRLYNTFLNLYRMTAFKAQLRAIGPDVTLQEAKTIARGINMLTGRGHVSGKLGSAVDSVGRLLSAPRLLISNLEAIAGAPLYTKNKTIRREFAKTYAKTFAAYAMLYGLAEAYDRLDGEDDLKVGLDPRSSDFGKIVIGKRRIDVLGGLGQIFTLLGRSGTLETKSTKGKVSSLRGKGRGFKGDDLIDVGGRFLRYKLSPSVDAAWDVVTGEQTDFDKSGKPKATTAGSVLRDLVQPITFQDILKDMKELGVPEAVALRTIGLIGITIRDYDR